ncbi:MAG: Crp/Fnr family transcriptional regulator [Hungatella sp.]
MLDNSYFTLPEEKNIQLEQILKKYASIHTYPAKKIFSEPGDRLNGICYIAEGRTRHYMADDEGAEKLLYILNVGWYFGETPNFLNESTGLYSITEVKTTLYKIPMDHCRYLMDNNKIFRDSIMRSCSKKMLLMRYEIENLAFHSCKDRLKQLFCSTADVSATEKNPWYNMRIHYTQYEISTIVGGARITVNKLMNELCAEGFIQILNRKVQVNAAEYLKYMSQNKFL